MAEKLKNIKETASDAVEIIKELGSPDVQESLEKIKETAKVAREVIESFKDPEMVKNIENIRRTSESFDNISAKMENIMKDVKSFGGGDNKNMGEMMDAIKEMLRSISALMDELKFTVASSKKEGVIHDAEEAVRTTRSIFTAEEKSKQ
jgi:mevalonate kinase